MQLDSAVYTVPVRARPRQGLSVQSLQSPVSSVPLELLLPLLSAPLPLSL